MTALPADATDRPDPATLVLAFRSGQRGAFDQLLADHRPLLWGLVRNVTVVGHSPDDLHQEASIAFLEAVNRFDPDRGVPFGAFVTRVVKARVANLLRDQNAAKRQAPGPVASIDAAVYGSDDGRSVPSMEPRVEDGTRFTETRIDIRAALPLSLDAGSTLDQVLANVDRYGVAVAVDMFYSPAPKSGPVLSADETKAAVLLLDGVGLADIAGALGWNLKKADNTSQRVRRKFRRLLGREAAASADADG